MIKIASAPVCWGIYEFDEIAPPFAYTQVLDEIAETGYTGVELGPYGYLPTDPALLREELETRGFRLLSAFVPVKLVDEAAHEAAAEQALTVGRLLKALDATHIVLADDNGKVPELVREAGRREGSKLTGAQWDTVAAGVTLIARRVRDALGLETVFHHHCAGYVETPEETRQLMSRLDADLVGLCLDTGHWHYGGGDALECVREYGARVRYLHLKDYNAAVAEACRARGADYFEAVAAGVFCPLGEGVVDFPAVLAAMRANGYEGWAVVEQDIIVDDPAIPKRYSQANRDYLRAIGL